MSVVAEHMSQPVLTVKPDERLDIARALMCSCHCRHLAVVEGGRLVGVLSLGDVLAAAPIMDWTEGRARALGLREIPVERAMRWPVATIAPDASVAAAAALLERRRVGCLPVVDGEALVGMLTRTDLFRAAIAAFAEAPNAPTAAQLMTPSPLTVAPGEPLDLAHALMKAERVRHLPVVDGEHVVGMLSQHDVLGAVGDDAPIAAKHALAVAEVMSAPVVAIGAERPAAEAAEVLRRRRLGALPVVRGGRLVGILTTADFFHHLASLGPAAVSAV